jgi:hypothetical protein
MSFGLQSAEVVSKLLIRASHEGAAPFQLLYVGFQDVTPVGNKRVYCYITGYTVV